MGDAVVCDFCGRRAPLDRGDQLPLAWSTAKESGRDKVFCTECSRRYVRSMEAKLDSEWW